MARIPLLKAIKTAFLLAIGAVGVWAMWPPSEERPIQASDSSEPAAQREVEYLLRVGPSGAYMPGTIPYGLGDPLNGFAEVARAYERLHPDTRIEIVNVPQGREYLVTQLSSGNAPDIVAVNVEDVWADIQKGWYVPLDSFLNEPNPYVVREGGKDAPGSRQWWDMFRYQAITRGKVAPDGSNYCISLDMVETSIFYNKTFFDEHGFEEPETWTEWFEILSQIKEMAGPEGEYLIPLLMSDDAFSDWCVDLVFDQLYHDLLPGIDLAQDDAVREAYMQGYLDWDEIAFLHQKGFFTKKDPRYVELWRILRKLADYCNRDLESDDQYRNFVSQRAIMWWMGSWEVHRVALDPARDFEWDVFYLPRVDREFSRFSGGHPMCVVGGSGIQYEVTNTALKDTDPSLSMEERIAQSERLKRVVGFLQFLTLPENCERVVNERISFIPNIVGVEPRPELQPFVDVLEGRYTTTKWVYTFDLRFSEIQRRTLILYLRGGITLDEFLDMWQIPNVSSATSRAITRKKLNLSRLEDEWERLAPVRTEMGGLPPS